MRGLSAPEQDRAVYTIALIHHLRRSDLTEAQVASAFSFESAEAMYRQLREWGFPEWLVRGERPGEVQGTFVRAGQSEQTHQQDETGLPPWDSRTALYFGDAMEKGWPLDLLAQLWLKELARVRLSQNWSKQGGAVDYPPGTQHGYLRRVELEKGQVLWLRFGGPRVEVLAEPRVTDVALRALLGVLEGGEVSDEGLERVRKAVDQWDVGEVGVYLESEAAANGVVDGVLLEPREERLLECADAFLRNDRPELVWPPADESAEQREERLRQQRALRVGLCQRISEAVKAARRLAELCEFGKAGKDLRREIEDAQMDVRAAELKHIEGLTHREIGEQLRIPVPKSSKSRGGHSTVSRMVKRGERLLKLALGEDGFRAWVESARRSP